MNTDREGRPYGQVTESNQLESMLFEKLKGVSVKSYSSSKLTTFLVSIGLVRGDAFSFWRTIFVRDDLNLVRRFKLIAYESVGIHDMIKQPVLYVLSILFPHWLALFSLLSLLGGYFLFALLLIPFAFPLGIASSFRAELLMRKYSAFIAINMWRYGRAENTLRWIINDLISMGTYCSIGNRGEAIDLVHKYVKYTRATNNVFSISVNSPSKTLLDLSPVFSAVYYAITSEDRNED